MRQNKMHNDLPNIRGSYRLNADLSKQCWFQVGGPADLLFKPLDSEDLASFLIQYKNATPIFILGVGSNILINDQGFRGCVIRLGRGFSYIKRDGNNIICGAGSLDINVARYALEEGLGGLEFLSGIPGTIGGALAMNAGAYGREIVEVLVNATAINKQGESKIFSPDEIGYSYRNKALDEDWIFIEATLKAIPTDSAIISSIMDGIQQQRQQTQPIKSRTSGSTFRNPHGHKAWELIDAASCRGLTIGGAQVSTMHCNFFINTGGASAQNIIDLIATVKQRVYEHSGVMLHEEIKII